MDSKRVKKLRFCRDWLKNEKYKSWIKEVPDDDSVYFCAYCNKTFSCTSRVSKHAESETHQNNKFKDVSEETKVIDKESRKRKFCHSWFENKEFTPWLKKIPNDQYNCSCSFCDVTFRCGLDSIRRHSDTKKHISECQKRSFTVDLNTLDKNSPLSYENRKNMAEIKFAALIAEKNIPFQTAESILSFFQDLGKDPHVLENMTMNRKKAPEIINNVLYVREQKRLFEILQNNKFSIFINETSDIINNKWMTVFVRYIDSHTLDIRTELFESINLSVTDRNDVEKLFTIFKDKMSKNQIPFQNVLALSDHASITIEKYELFKTKLEKYCENLITMPNPCQASALVVNEACTAIPEACEELLRKLSSFISSNQKRANLFKHFQQSFNCKKSYKLSERLLSRHSCVARMNENWDMLLKYLQDEQLSDKSKSGAALLFIMQNPEIQAYFLFLEYILDVFNKFNASFQTQETKVHLFQAAAENLMVTVLRNVAQISCNSSLSNSVVDDIINLLNQNESYQVTVGQACQDLLNQLNEKGEREIVKLVYLNCSSFYNIAVKEIRQRLFLKEEILSKLRIFDPKFALQEANIMNDSIQDVLFVAKGFGIFDEKLLRNEWESLNLDFTLEQKAHIINLNFDDAWKILMVTKDEDGKFKYPIISKLINGIRSLPNFNVDAEKIFSMLTNMKLQKRNKLSAIHVETLCVFKSCLKMRGETARTMNVDAQHLALMATKNLYQKKRIRKRTRSPRVSVAVECPSTSSNL